MIIDLSLLEIEPGEVFLAIFSLFEIYIQN